METSRLRYTCSVIKSTSMNRNISTWVLVVVIVVLHLFSFMFKTWYKLYINLDSCVSCGPLIVTIGTIFENSNVGYADNNVQSNENVDTFRSGLIDRHPAELVIETGIYVYIGLWKMTFCLADGRTCTALDHSTSSIILRNVQPIADMLESAYDSRPFLLLAIVSHLLMVFFTRLRPAGTTTSDVRMVAGMEVGSAVFSLMAAVIAIIPYITTINYYHFVVPLMPWALFSAMLSGYLSFVLAYQIWKSQPSKLGSFRTWQAHQLYKYHA